MKRAAFNALGWLTGWLLVRGAKLALSMGDRHEFDHIRAAIAAGNSANCTASRCCLDLQVERLEAEAAGRREIHRLQSGIYDVTASLDPGSWEHKTLSRLLLEHSTPEEGS